MQNSLKCLVLVAGMACATSAVAESVSENLTKIEAETLLLKAREKQLDAQAKIIAKQNEIAYRQSESGIIAPNRPISSADPVVHSVEGIGKVVYANLQMENGSMIEARAGDVLPNGMKVVSVRANEVTVETAGKQRVRLVSRAQASSGFNPNYPSAGVTLPPLPPVAAPRGPAK